MAKLSDEEKTLLDQLTAKSKAADDDSEDFEVEWWEEDDKGHRRGGRVPWSKGKSIYGQHFPNLFGDKPPAGKEGGKEGDKGDPPPAGGSGGTAGKYFGGGGGGK